MLNREIKLALHGWIRVNKVIEIGQQAKRVFTLGEANDLLPLIYHLTEESYSESKIVLNQIKAFQQYQPKRAAELEIKMQQIVEKWQSKVERLGVQAQGLWIADFDNGTGYFCWKYPETKISFYHGYKDGFSGRMLITEDTMKMPSESGNSERPSELLTLK